MTGRHSEPASLASLEQRLRGLDGRGYKAYKQVKGDYACDGSDGGSGDDSGGGSGGESGKGFTLIIDHVQGDPFAEPSRLRAHFPATSAGLPPWAIATVGRRTSTADFLNRELWRVFDAADTRCGSGKSGAVELLRPGQQVLLRSSVVVSETGAVEARFRVGLPAGGRRILGPAAARLCCEQVPQMLAAALVYDDARAAALRRHVEVVEDAQALRRQLGAHGLVAFVADGAVLPRLSGIDDRPLSDRVVTFASPPSLRVTLEAPNAGDVSGMGVPVGVTLIVGGGYHGKSTLLRAIERGVYDHIPGDGCEAVVADAAAVKVRAEDGRRVERVDISAFINNLPDGQDTTAFCTDNASGSTSQAAAIAEALELGASCLLLDEDTSATNFMIRDARMQRLVAAADEPITPFIDRVCPLHKDYGVSTVLVVGGAGDYFDVADTVINMCAYVPQEVTAAAKRIAAEMPDARVDVPPALRAPAPRVPLPRSVDPRRGKRDVNIKAYAEDRILFGTEEVELAAVEQLVERAQTRAIAEALVWAKGGEIDGERNMAAALGKIIATIDPAAAGLDVLVSPPRGDFAAFRVFELAAFLNRLRTLRIAP